MAEVAGRVPLTIALDSAEAAEPIAEALRARGTEAEALVELDVGLARTGLDPERALELGRAIDGFGGGLRLAGLSCYPGHLRHDEQVVEAGIREVDSTLERARAMFEEAGLDCGRISGGSTATLFHSHETPMSEIRPGNYALLDRQEARGEFELADCALHVHTTVVSTAVPGRFIVDAGAKTLSEAGPPPGAERPRRGRRPRRARDRAAERGARPRGRRRGRGAAGGRRAAGADPQPRLHLRQPARPALRGPRRDRRGRAAGDRARGGEVRSRPSRARTARPGRRR